jgi:TPR repeat protein
MRYAAHLVLSATVSLITGVCGSARADWDSAMIARQRGDLAAAYSAFEQEAQGGAVDAQAVVGEMLIKGQGVPPTVVRSQRCWRMGQWRLPGPG